MFDRGSDADTANMGSNLSVNQQHPDGGTIFPGSVNRTAPASVPQVTLAVEHYNRMVRLIEHDVPVKVELDLKVQFYDNAKGFNIVGEIPGSDPALAGEVVMLGAHFDSHPFATGATDNATGSTAMLEALRIIKTLGLKPRRTIRVGLWCGEEQGLLGSRAYVAAHFGDPQTMQLKPEHAKLAAYFNLDNGTGKIRGIWMQGNLAARPIFEQWIAPLKDLGVTILGPARRRVDRPLVVRRGRPARLPVRPGPSRIQRADAPLEHGHLRPRPAGRSRPAGDDRRGVRLQRRDARREAAAQSPPQAVRPRRPRSGVRSVIVATSGSGLRLLSRRCQVSTWQPGGHKRRPDPN